ncbi:universal stress protein [Mycobacterium kiyosense]|uniref:Universal stress protein n=2 Tax=Mycobacteriaceae TaxID=1762 RepID=A0A9P3Q6I2_9MYCO|nr:universal stress protein [Mycobacterium kiyosense]BDE14848.1 universal stress protein [Mycobacterium sp. 20KCMC460]GLB82222.1 universal stress protein [Mycobacterium kiyosense]GLB89272.1 universal stress protein [Mycobacterium kiyosense]GLB95926.1 universal stress protein [Mycobacterium kiyosense]
MRNLPLTLVHTLNAFVPTFPQVPLPAGVAVWQEEDAQRVLEDAAKLAQDVVEGDRNIAISMDMRCAPAAPTLIDMSEDAAMVVVGSHGRGAAGRAVLGSVSSGVLHGAACPVAVIRDYDQRSAHELRRVAAPVVVGIDGSPVSELATAIAFDEAACRGVDLVAVHAWTDLDAADLPGLDWPAIRSEVEEVLAERLAGWQERYPDVTVHRVVSCGRPAQALLEHANSAQLVVLGSHGRGGLKRMLLGSVSHAVVHSTHTPIIVARPT